MLIEVLAPSRYLIESAFRLTVKTPSSDFTLTVCESAPVARRARRMVPVAADLMLLIKFLLYFSGRRLGERQWELKTCGESAPTARRHPHHQPANSKPRRVRPFGMF